MTTNTDDDRMAEFERITHGKPHDETDFGVRAYVTRIPPEKLAEYDPAWSNEQVAEWDGNFKSDGGLMLVCCERDVGVPEFRRVLEEFIEFQKEKT